MMEVITEHGLDEEILVKCLKYEWKSFVGVPSKGHPTYPEKCRVRQLLSRKQLKSKRWKEFLAENEGGESDGTEPISYNQQRHGVAKPRLFILVDDWLGFEEDDE